MNDNDKFHKAGDILKELFNRIVPENAEGYSRFFSGWAILAGEETAFHVHPKDIINGTLVLESDHPGWSQRIKMREEGLLRSIRDEYPELNIVRLRVVIDRGQKRTVKSKPDSRPSTQNVMKTENTNEISRGEDEAFFALLEKFKHNADS